MLLSILLPKNNLQKSDPKLLIFFFYTYVDIVLEVKDRIDFNPDWDVYSFNSTVIWSQHVLQSVSMARNCVNWLNI